MVGMGAEQIEMEVRFLREMLLEELDALEEEIGVIAEEPADEGLERLLFLRGELALAGRLPQRRRLTSRRHPHPRETQPAANEVSPERPPLVRCTVAIGERPASPDRVVLERLRQNVDDGVEIGVGRRPVRDHRAAA